MRGFVVLGFIAVALARPEGYNYAHPIVNSPFFPSFGHGFGSQNSQFAGGSQFGAGSQFSAGSQFTGSNLLTSQGVGAPFLGAGSSSFGHTSHLFNPTVFSHANAGTLSHGFGVSTVAPPVHHAPVITKHFHSFAAPEETEEEVRQEHINLGPSHKHYRVIFIKAPHQNAHSAALTIAQAANEEKTIIYVLSKKPDAAEIHTAIKEAHSVPSKPEVFFIKYKTHEEAEHAQHVIKSKYDALGGSSKVSDEGIAPVTSVIGSLGPVVGGSGVSVAPSPVYPTPLTPVQNGTPANYLPPK